MWISEDFSAKVRFERKKLLEFAARFMEQHVRYKLSFDQLHVGSEIYVYEGVAETVIPIQRPRDVSRADD